MRHLISYSIEKLEGIGGFSFYTIIKLLIHNISTYLASI